MALTKTVLDGTAIGTIANFGDLDAGTLTMSDAYATGASQSTNILDVTGKVGVAIVFRGLWTTAPSTRPKLEVFTSPFNDADTMDTMAYETIELASAINSSAQVTLPLRFAEDLNYIQIKVTNGTVADSTAKYYVAVIETSL